VPDVATGTAGVATPPLPGLAGLRRIAIVPAFNEEGAVGGVIDEIRAYDPGFDVVVVDDGSRDRTSAAARAKGAHVLTLPFNLGIGGRCRRASSSPGSRATSSRCAATATASTTRRSWAR